MVIHTAVLSRLGRLIGNDHMILVFLALIAGSLAGGAVVAFRELISLVQAILYESGSERLFSNADAIQWWKILLAPVGGGLVVGLYNQKEIWPIFGYEGESFSKGGYIDRGFDDIAWL